MSATHRYAHEIWKVLEKQAKPDTIYGEGKPVFRGRYTDIWEAVGASKAFYPKVRKYLLDNRFIEIIEQGSRNRESIIVLWECPPEDLPEDRPDDFTKQDLTVPARVAKMEERLAALTAWRDSLGGLNIREAFFNVEKRLARLEAKEQISQPNGSEETGD